MLCVRLMIHTSINLLTSKYHSIEADGRLYASVVFFTTEIYIVLWVVKAYGFKKINYNKMKELLEEIGFKHLTGPLWKHDDIGIVSINEGDKPTDIAKRIYERGYSECQLVIRSSLGVID